MPIDKKKLIGYCNEIKGEINVSDAIRNENKKEDKKGVGTSQFRDIATVCKSCETYDEIELLIKYKIAKDKDNSWRNNCSINREKKLSIGEAVLNKMEKINKDYQGNEEDMLYALSLFFGYLFQSARVWQYELPDNNKGDNSNNNNGRKNYSDNSNNNNGKKNYRDNRNNNHNNHRGGKGYDV